MNRIKADVRETEGSIVKPFPEAPVDAFAATPFVATVMAGYPGAVLLVLDGDEVLAANGLASVLLAEDQGWWEELSPWRAAAQAGSAGSRSTQLQRPSGIEVYEWLAVRLDDRRLLLLGNDVTLERQLRQTLTESRQRYKDLVDISSDFAWETGPDGCFVFVSPRGALGYPAEALVGRSPRDLVIASEGEEGADLALPFDAERPVDRAEIWLRRADGNAAHVQTTVKPLFDSRNCRIGARGVCRDFTEQTLRLNELSRTRNRERVLNHIVHTLRDQLDAAKALEVAARETTRAISASGCVIHRLETDGAGTIAASFGEPATAGFPGDWPGDWLLSALPGIVTTAEPLEYRMGAVSVLACRTRFRQTVNGTVCVWREADGVPWDEDALQLIAGVADRIGITHAQLAYQDRLRHLSERDSLTNLYNRRTFLERLEEMLTWRDFGPSSLLYIDLDNFKAVNDLRGHREGDAVLRAVAGLISQGIRPGDLCGRLGGDEFLLWLARSEEEGGVTVAKRLLAGIETLRSLSAGPERPLGLSIGIAVHIPNTQESVTALIERADTAMYQAKVHGKGSYCVADRIPGCKQTPPPNQVSGREGSSS